jgi:hypothetical protein
MCNEQSSCALDAPVLNRTPKGQSRVYDFISDPQSEAAARGGNVKTYLAHL